MSENNRKTICVCCIFIQQIILGFLQWVRKLLNFRVMLPIFAWIMYFAALAIGGCFVYRTFWGQDNNTLESINININDEKGKKKELSAERKSYLKEQLHTALMEVSGKAEAAYNDKFATLLTILTIFGIAWPLVLAYLQNKNLEQDRNAISEANEKAKDIYEKNQLIMSEIQKQKKDIQDHKEVIVDLQRSSHMQFGVFYLKYIADSGLFLTYKFDKREGKKDSTQSGTPQFITRIFKILLCVVNAFYEAESLVPSKDTHNSDSLKNIRDAAKKIYNLVWNYNSIIYEDVITEFKECIANIDNLDHNFKEIPEALRYLNDAKDLLEKDYAKQ